METEGTGSGQRQQHTTQSRQSSLNVIDAKEPNI